MRSLKFRLHRNCLKTIYVSHIRSALEYCDVIWDNCTAEQALKLEHLQLDCIRIITGLPKFCSNENLYRESGFDTLSERRRQHRLVVTFRAVALNECPPYFLELLPTLRRDATVRNNRHYFTFELYHIARNNTFLHSFLPKTIKEWNKLSVEARSATNLRFFKMKIRPLPVNTSSVLQNPRYPSIKYTRIRNNCSALNAHLYHANLIASPMCDCNTGPENTFHFLYNCPFFDTERERLMLELDSLGLVDLSIPVLFQCDQHLDPPIIPSVQKAVFRYILNTKRFC